MRGSNCQGEDRLLLLKEEITNHKGYTIFHNSSEKLQLIHTTFGCVIVS
jgi:hypothetical protein